MKWLSLIPLGDKLDSLNKIDESSSARKKTKRIEFVSNDVKYILQVSPCLIST